jgi:hypothetical protein
MAMTETTLLHRLLLAFTRTGTRVFRNQVGMGWQGKVFHITTHMSVQVAPGDVVIKHARPLRSGLCPGSSDCIGWKTVEITPQLVGQRIAAFVAVEVKTDRGRLSEEQQNFLRAVRDAGGIAIEARNVNDAVTDLERQITPEKTK